MAEFSGMIRARYPELGRVAGTDGPPDSGMPSTVLIDGITISMSIVNAPYPPEALLSPTRLIDHVDPEPLVANQAAYVLLAVEGPDIDPQAFGKAAAEASEIAQAYAALLTLAASVVAAEAPAMAAFWADSWRLVPPERLVEAGEGIMDGRLPWELWTSFAEVKGARAGGGDNRALISFGLRKFAGREVEVAPSPIPLVEAEKLAQAMVGRLIAGDQPVDHEETTLGSDTAVLRRAERFLRPRHPALVVVPASSPWDPETLEDKRTRNRRSGLVGRLFGG